MSASPVESFWTFAPAVRRGIVFAREDGTIGIARALTTKSGGDRRMRQVKYRSYTPGLNPRRTKLEVARLGRRQAASQGRLHGAGLALPAVLGGRPLRNRALLPLPEFAPGRDAGAATSYSTGTSVRRRKDMAASGRRSGRSESCTIPTRRRSTSRSRRGTRSSSSPIRGFSPIPPTRRRSRFRR